MVGGGNEKLVMCRVIPKALRSHCRHWQDQVNVLRQLPVAVVEGGVYYRLLSGRLKRLVVVVVVY